MELQNPGPACFEVKMLTKAMPPRAARNAADNGHLAMISDKDCKQRIMSVAMEMYQHEEKIPIWHKNICGERAGNNHLYSYICRIHGFDQPMKSRSPPSQSVSTPFGSSSACRFSKHHPKPCALPYLDSRKLVHLAYFDSLFYVTVAKIQELHKELRDRLEHGLIKPDTVLCLIQNPPDNVFWSCNVENFLGRLSYLWDILTSPEVVATLDVALRLRNIGHWSVILEDDRNLTSNANDCREHRADLLSQKPGQAKKNELFLNASGLLNVFGHRMSSPIICVLVNDLHAKAMHEKQAFHDYLINNIDSVRQEINQHRRAKSDGHTLPLRQGSGRLDSHKSMKCESDWAKPSSFPDEAIAKVDNVQVDGEEMRAPLITPVERTRSAPTLMKRRRGPKEVYSLNLYMTNFAPSELPRNSTVSSQPPDLQKELPPTPPLTPSDGNFNRRNSHSREGPSEAAGQGHKVKEVTQIVETSTNGSRGIPLPPIEGTWTISKDALYSILPKTPTYPVHQVSMMASQESCRKRGPLRFLGWGWRAVV